mgnify:CR=1 FL=1
MNILKELADNEEYISKDANDLTIDKLNAINFLVFKRNKFNSFNIDFSKGINIIIGENGTGKTTLLKMLYAASEFSNQKTHPKKAKNISDYFISDPTSINALKNLERAGGLFKVSRNI